MDATKGKSDERMDDRYVDFRGRSPIVAIRSPSENRRESGRHKQREWREERGGKGKKKEETGAKEEGGDGGGEKKRRKVDRGLAVVATVKVELTPSCHV